MVQEYRAKGSQPASEPTRPPKGTPGTPRLRWVFHGAPIPGPGGHVPFMVPEEIADGLAAHLDSLSMWTRDELLLMADEDGTLDVSRLPARTIRHDPPESGPHVWGNPGRWVPVSEPEPVPRVKIDAEGMTDEQAEMLAEERAEIDAALRRREAMKLRWDNADPHVRRPQ